MGLYVEVMCDLKLSGSKPGNILVHKCISDRGDNPQGYSVASARKDARAQGWKVGPGNKAVCPGCLGTEVSALIERGE